MIELLADKRAFTEALLERLEGRAQQLGESEAEMSRRLGMSEGLFKNLRKGSLPGADRLDVILAEVGVSLTLGVKAHPLQEPVEPSVASDKEFAHIPLHDALLAAGAGACNGSEEVIDNLAFRKDWLKRIGVSASSARLARVQGDSMQPNLWPGDMILIDTRSNTPPERAKDQRDQRRSPIYALLDHGEARVKRIQRVSDDTLMMLSDNPEYQPELRQGKDLADLHIIGKVVWWGHTAKE